MKTYIRKISKTVVTFEMTRTSSSSVAYVDKDKTDALSFPLGAEKVSILEDWREATEAEHALFEAQR